jgi:hypothetical protein
VNYLFYLYNVIALEIVFKDQILLDLYLGKRTNDKLFKSNPLLVRKFQKTIIKISAIESFNLISQNRGLNYEKLKDIKKIFQKIEMNRYLKSSSKAESSVKENCIPN